MTPKTILITGATRGIGRHAALHLARRGHTVIATGRRADALAELRADAAALPVQTVVLDVTDPESITAAHASVLELTRGHGVDVLINNAGYGQMGPVLEVTPDEVRAQYETNVVGLLAVTKAFSGEMMARGSGRILNVSSIGGRISMPLGGVYTSSKFAVEALSDALRQELAPFGVQVVVVQPSAIRTGFATTAKASIDQHDHAGSRCAEAYAASEGFFEEADAMAPGPEAISAAFAHAIEARRPAARYAAPLAARLALVLSSVVPTWLLDAVLTRIFGLHRVAPSLTRPALA